MKKKLIRGVYVQVNQKQTSTHQLTHTDAQTIAKNDLLDLKEDSDEQRKKKQLEKI